MGNSLLQGFRIGDRTVRPLRGTITGPDGTEHVQPKVLQVLVCLAEKAPEVLTRDQLTQEVWRGDAATDEVLTRCIYEVRHHLGDHTRASRFLQTVPKVGYRLIEPVVALSPVKDSGTSPATAGSDGTESIQQVAREQTGDDFRLRLARFWSQLKRRRVIKTAAAYMIGAAILVEAADLIFPLIMFPQWTVRFVLVLAVIGLPLMLWLAWMFDIERTDSTDQERGKPKPPIRRSAPPSPDSAVVSVAVLPFEVLSGDPEHTFLAEGIAAELHGILSRVHRLRVASRTSSFAYRGRQADVRKIARKLNVHYVLCGSVRCVGDHMRVIVGLDSADEGMQIWTETYDRDVGDVFSVQSDIAHAVASAFGGERLRQEITNASRQPTSSFDAWSQVQRARSYILDYSPQALAEAVPLLRRALELDADYAAAHAALGSVLAESILNGLSSEATTDESAALEAATRAFTLSPADPFVLKMCGSVWAYFGETDKSLTALRHAVEIAPFDFGAWGYMGWPLVETGVRGDLEDLHDILERILRVAPKHPGAPYWFYHKSVAYTCEGHDAPAVEFAAKAVEHNPSFSWGWMQYANSLGHTGTAEEARMAVARCAEINPAMTPGHFASRVRVMSDVEEVVEKRLGGLRAARIL